MQTGFVMRKLVSAGLAGTIGVVLLAPPAQAKIHIEILKPIVIAKVDRTTQRMHVTVNGKKKYTWKVSTGAKTFETPRGTFRPYRMHKMWYSRKYDMAPMPHAVFYKGGFAVHATFATGKLGLPASHGCVRLSPANAKHFYNLVKKHGRTRTEISIRGGFSWATYRKRQRKIASARKVKQAKSNRNYAYTRYQRRRRPTRSYYRGSYAPTSGYGYARPYRRQRYYYRGY